MSDLPHGWVEASFGDLFDFRGGSQPPKSEFIGKKEDGYVRLLQIRDFESDAKAVFIRDASRWAKCNEKDIMIGRYGASVGKILSGKAGAYNVALVKMIFDRELLEREWVRQYLLSDHFQRPLQQISRSAQNGFNKEDLDGLYVPLAPAREQRRIVAKIDRLSANSGRARARLDHLPRLIEKYKQAVLAAAFRGDLTVVNDWPKAPFFTVLDFKGGSQPPKPTFSAVPGPGLVRLLQIRDFASDAKAIYIKDSRRWSKCVENDIMLGRYGASVGKVLTGKAGAYNVALVKMIYHPDRLDRQFLYHWLRADEFQGALEAVSRSAQNEPPRVCRRLFRLSHAAMAGCSVTA
jgi:Type I restriction modification DNA specificity domain